MILLTFVICFCVVVPGARAQTWSLNADGNWNVNGNWSPATFPNAVGATVTFGNGITSDRIITLGANVTAGQLIFDEAQNYRITDPTRVLTLDVASGSTSIQVNSTVGNGAHTIASGLRLNDSLVLEQNSSGTFTIGGVIQGASGSVSITKTGSGAAAFSGANTFTGPVSVSAGTLVAANNAALGTAAGGVTVAGGATLGVTGGVTILNEPLTLAGSGVGGFGALRNLSGANRYQGNITLSAAAEVGSDSGTLRLGQGIFNPGAYTLNNGGFDLTVDGGGDVESNLRITGSGGLIKNGSGTLSFVMVTTNSYTGSTLVNSGRLVLDTLNNANGGIRGPLTVGDDLGGSGADIVQLGDFNAANEQIANDQNVTVNSSGLLRLNGQLETFANLTLKGGQVDMNQFQPAGATVGRLTLTGGLTTEASATTASVSGRLNFTAVQPVVSVADGAAAVDLDLGAAVTTGGGLVKNGAGTLRLTGTITAGSSIPNDQILVNSGTLLLGAANRISDTTPMTLNGGTFATGGFSEQLGVLTLTANSTIDFGAGASVLRFSSSSLMWAAGLSLDIVNWSGNAFTGSGVDQLHFGAITSTDLARIRFTNPAGLPPGVYGARLIGMEVVPVPEPGTWAVLALLAAGVWSRHRKQRGAGVDSTRRQT